MSYQKALAIGIVSLTVFGHFSINSVVAQQERTSTISQIMNNDSPIKPGTYQKDELINYLEQVQEERRGNTSSSRVQDAKVHYTITCGVPKVKSPEFVGVSSIPSAISWTRKNCDHWYAVTIQVWGWE
jgi:hypothetical protein